MLPEFARTSVIWGPVIAMGIFAAMLLLALGVNLFVKQAINQRKRRSPDGIDTLMMASLKGPVVLFIVIFGVFLWFITLTEITHPAFNFIQGWDNYARKVWLAVIILEVSFAASHLLQSVVRWYIKQIASRTASTVDNKIAPIISRFIPAVIYPLGILVALDTVGVSINPLLAGMGIGGIAVALALSPTIASYIAGTYIVTEGRIKEGDYIELEGGPAGFVLDVGWRSTTVRSRFNNIVIIPNSKLSESIITNYSAPTPVLTGSVECGVSYESNLDEVERISLEVARQVVKESPVGYEEFEPRVRFASFGDSNIDFRVVFQATDRVGSLEIQSQIIKRLHQRFIGEGIEINYPVRKLLFPKGTGQSLTPGPG
ncbi:MAG: mechanosensitive ion channel family protein [Chloroflexi bacterium]|nr:mechanosensitive ion channel family protein [Chloroflexota bacterium]MDA1219144.1 mechanosensitive ion channel family protein [Chloroflexota bacterium]